MIVRYPGHIPFAPKKDAKYSVISSRRGTGGMEIRLIYTVRAGVRELLTTDRHDQLVDMVNNVKVHVQGQPGGVFYINEYRDVLVPAARECFYAGNYPTQLEFDYEGRVLGPRAPRGLGPGDPWSGPHVGVKYTLTADGCDIKYQHMETPTRQVTVLLSDHVGAAPARQLAKRLSEHKGSTGGIIYINEACEFFSPIQGNGTLEYVYLGALEDDPWFPAPDVRRPED